MGARAPPRTAAQGRGRPRRRAPRWRGRRGRRAVGSWFPCRFPGERCRGAETLAALTAAANALSCARRQRRCEGGDMAGVPFDRHRAVVLPEWIDYNGDRKSVVEGKSVSVRVDLGGSRINKK